MGTRIATNVESLRGLTSLNKSSDLQSRTLTRLSTGTQINSGKDNPAGLIGSETLRAQATSIEQSIKNSNRANNVIGTADSALGEINNLLNQIRGLVQEGVNKGALSSTEISANQSQIDAALSAINRISANTTFAGDKLLDGSKAFTTTITSADNAKLTDYQVSEALFGSASSVTLDATVVTAATKGKLTYSGGNLNAATTLQVAGARGSELLFLGSGSSLTNITNAVNAVTDVTGVTASITTAAIAGTVAVNSAASEALTINGGGANDALKFVAKRNPQDATANPISVTFADPGAASSALSVSVTGNAITVNLATDSGSAITSTANQVRDAIRAHAAANALVNVHATEGTGDGVLAAAASANLTYTAATDNNNNLTFTDNRQNAGASDKTLKVAFAHNVTTPSQTLSFAVAETANDITVTVNLATDASGQVTTTGTTLAAGLAADTAASALLSVANTGASTGAGILSATSAAATITGGVNGVITLTSSEYGSKKFVDVQALSGSFATQNSASTAATREAGSDIVTRINGQTAAGEGLKATLTTSLLSASITFKEANNVALTNAKITIAGGGSLFQIGQNVDVSGQVGIGIEAVNTAKLGGAAGKIFELGSGRGKSLVDVAGGSAQGSNLVDIIGQARDRVNSLRSRLGALQKNVIETNINSLQVALENVSEARSAIADTDFATETANLTKSQILVQAGISALQIANSAPQQVLSLLRG